MIQIEVRQVILVSKVVKSIDFEAIFGGLQISTSKILMVSNYGHGGRKLQTSQNRPQIPKQGTFFDKSLKVFKTALSEIF